MPTSYYIADDSSNDDNSIDNKRLYDRFYVDDNDIKNNNRKRIFKSPSHRYCKHDVFNTNDDNTYCRNATNDDDHDSLLLTPTLFIINDVATSDDDPIIEFSSVFEVIEYPSANNNDNTDNTQSNEFSSLCHFTMSIYGPDLRLLFPSFDSKLAEILNATLDVPQEACNHICEVLIRAGATTWNHFICDIHEYAYIVDEYGSELKYQAQTDPRSTSTKDQHTLTSFVDFINDIMLQVDCYWHDHSQYTRDAFLAFCNARNQHPELTAVPTKANAAILASQPSVQAQSCLTKPPVLLPVSSSVSASITTPVPVLITPPAHVSVTPQTSASFPSQAPNSACETPVTTLIANNGNPLESLDTHRLASNTDLAPASTSIPSYTWTYFPRTESVRFRRVVSSTIPTVHLDTPPGDAYHITNRVRHSPRPSLEPSTHSRWTFHPKSATVTFHRSPKQFSSHKPSTSIPLLQLPSSGAFSKDNVVPSSDHATVPSTSHAYPQHGASSHPGRKPLYGAHSLTNNLPAVCFTKRHRDAIKLKLYHLHATLLVATWVYDDIA
eukprot:jgi/Psemu1/26651/gm1.26651_g